MYINQIKAFALADAMLGLIIISLAISLFCFNESNFLKIDNYFYLRNEMTVQAYNQSVLAIKNHSEVQQIIVHGKKENYEIDVQK